MKKILFSIALILTAGLTLISAGPVVAAQGPDCGKFARERIQSLSDNLNDFLDWPDFNPTPEPCDAPPPGYWDCMKAAREAFDDAMADATADAIDAMSSALFDAQFKMAILEAQYNAATTQAQKDAICANMESVGGDAMQAHAEAQQAFRDAHAAASSALSDAEKDCCEEGGEKSFMMFVPCTDTASAQIADLAKATYDMAGREASLPPSWPFCYDKPAGYQKCFDEAAEAFKDTMSDAYADAVDAMEDALNKARIQFTIGKAFYGKDSDKHQRHGCKLMKQAGEDAAFAQMDGEAAVMKAYGKALMDFYSAVNDCCYGDRVDK